MTDLPTSRSGPRWLFSGGSGAGWIAVYGAILAAWIGVVAMGTRFDAGLADMPADFWATLCLSAADADPFALWAMWALMAAAMMLPTFVPSLRTFADLGAAGASTTATMIALTGGYLSIWALASGLGAGLQIGLGQAGLIAPDGSSLSRWLSAGLLVVAGLYQFSSLKDACLSKCRMPLTFFMQYWQPGVRPAYAMGLRLGVICLGCCWALMLLGFVGGTMDLLWMGAATLFMALEKLPRLGRPLTRPAGYALLAGALIVALT